MKSSEPSQPYILLIDDSIADLRILLDMMSGRQWRTAVAFDGLSGYHKACVSRPDLILLDVMMPEMDGFATCRRLKADPVTQLIPVIFLTANDVKEERLHGFSLGAVDYIVKPFASEEEVLARIAIHLNLARRLGESPTRVAVAQGDQVGDSPLVRAATGLLLDELANPPSPEALAHRLGTNEKRLNDAFKAELALTVHAWVREQRLRLARELLAKTETPVSDIALHCGYSSPANFSTAFRARFDCSPRDFRIRCLQQRTLSE